MIRFACVVCLLCASLAEAQSGNCTASMLPVIGPGQPNGSAQYFWAIPPTDAEPWGHLEYPIQLQYPAGAASVSLITLSAFTFKLPGWEVQRLGYGGNGQKTYVTGRSGRYYEWVPEGIRFIWYHIPDTRIINGLASDGVTPESEFYITFSKSDLQGIEGENLSVPLRPFQEVLLGVNVLYPYPEPVLVEVQLHYQVCR